MNVFEEFLRELFTGEPTIREANYCGRSVIGKVDDQIIVKITLVSTERSQKIDAIPRPPGTQSDNGSGVCLSHGEAVHRAGGHFVLHP